MKKIIKDTLMELRNGETYKEVGERLHMSKQAIQFRLKDLGDYISQEEILKRIFQLDQYYYTAEELGIEDYELVGFKILNKDYKIEGDYLYNQTVPKPLYIKTKKDLSNTSYERHGEVYILPKISLPKLGTIYMTEFSSLQLTEQGWEDFKAYFNLSDELYKFNSYLSLGMTTDSYQLNAYQLGLRTKFAPNIKLLDQIDNILLEYKKAGRETVHITEVTSSNVSLDNEIIKGVKLDKDYYIYSLIKKELEWETTKLRDSTIVIGDYSKELNLLSKPSFIADYIGRHQGIEKEELFIKFAISDFDYTTNIRLSLAKKAIIQYCGKFYTWDYFKKQKELYKIFKKLENFIISELQLKFDVYYQDVAIKFKLSKIDIREIIHFIQLKNTELLKDLNFSLSFCTLLELKEKA